MTKICVISDTHIPIRASDFPEVLYKEFSSCDLILHAGDLISIEAFEKLKRLGKKFHAVSGNMDSPELIKILPRKLVIECSKFKIGLIHGYGNPATMLDSIRNEFNVKIDIMVFGHSHNPTNEIKNGLIYFNPGSPTDDIFAPFKSYGIIEINDEIKCRIERVS